MPEANDLVTPYFPVYSTPAEAATIHILDPTISAIFGGANPVLLPGEAWPRCGVCDSHLIPYIQINVSSPQTPSEFRQKVSVRPEAGHSVLLQVFVCAEDENAVCFQEAIVGADDSVCLVRIVQITSPSTNDDAQQAARAEMGEDRFFVQERVITGWTAGRPEVADATDDDGGDEELRINHAPAPGLKLLGSPVRGTLTNISSPRIPADVYLQTVTITVPPAKGVPGLRPTAGPTSLKKNTTTGAACSNSEPAPKKVLR